MYRQLLARQSRLFTTSTRVRKSVLDTAKDALKDVDKTVSQTLVKGIDASGNASQALQAFVLSPHTDRPCSVQNKPPKRPRTPSASTPAKPKAPPAK